MRFGTIATGQAVGAILAHSMTLTKGRLRKGQRLDAANIADLLTAGHAQVTVAQLEDGDLVEDVAAARLAEAIAGTGVRSSQAATGRANLFAKSVGVVQIDAQLINAFNAINPMITVATIPPFCRTSPDMMIATIKIISYAVPEADVVQACRVALDAIAVLPPLFSKATLIETQIGDVPSDKGRKALVGRLDRLGITLGPRVIVPHTCAALAYAIAEANEEAVFILTASATSDLDDVGPAAVRASGGDITQFGMPVDPGNLLFLGQHDQKPVIGLPGCARSPALNGADWVLERVMCGVQLTPADFAAMGVGGLLKEIPTRPKPRADI